MAVFHFFDSSQILHGLPVGRVQAVCTFHVFENRDRPVLDFLVVVDLRPVLAHPHRNDVYVFAVDVPVSEHVIGLIAVAHALHVFLHENGQPFVRQLVFGIGIERSVENGFSQVMAGVHIRFETSHGAVHVERRGRIGRHGYAVSEQ